MTQLSLEDSNIVLMSYARINMHVLYSFGLICINLYSGFFLYFVFYYVTLLYLKCSIVLRVRIKDDDDRWRTALLNCLFTGIRLSYVYI